MSERLPRTYFRSHGDHAWSRIFIWFSRHASREEVCRVQHKRHGGCAGAISNATTASLSLLHNCPCGDHVHYPFVNDLRRPSVFTMGKTTAQAFLLTLPKSARMLNNTLLPGNVAKGRWLLRCYQGLLRCYQGITVWQFFINVLLIGDKGLHR